MMTAMIRKRSTRSGSWRKGLNILMIALMLLALLPPAGAASADDSRVPVIRNMYTSATQPEDGLIPRSTINPISLEVEVPTMTADQIDRIYYTLENITTGYKPSTRDIRGRLDASGMLITFDNVVLTEGLNRIQVIMEDESGNPSSRSNYGWVYFTPMTGINNILVDGVPLTTDEIFPRDGVTDPWSSLIAIEGTVYNASEVNVYHHQSAITYTAPVYNNKFSVTADRQGGMMNAAFRLEPGDNMFTFIARYGAHSSQERRTLIYDNGESFIFNMKLDDQLLIEEPNISRSGSGHLLPLDGKIKVNIVEGALEFDTLKIYVNAKTAAQTVADLDIATLQKDSALSEPGLYDVYDLPGDIVHDPANLLVVDTALLTGDESRHNLLFEFSRGVVQHNIMKSFRYHDTDKPYIGYAARKISDDDLLGLRLSSLMENEISEQPVTFYIYTDDKTEGVNIYIDDPSAPSPHFVANEIASPAPNGPRFEVSINDIDSGDRVMYIFPVYENAAGQMVEHRAGHQRYTLRMNTTPYVIVHNVRNNEVIQGPVGIDKLTGRLVNMSNAADVKVILNSRDITHYLTVDPLTNLFELELSENTSQSNALAEGRNTLIFEMYRGGRSYPVAETTLVLYRYRLSSPVFESIEIVEEDPSNPKFIQNPDNPNPDAYSTSHDRVTLMGRFANADELTISIERVDINDTTPTTVTKTYDVRNPNLNNDPYMAGLDEDEFLTKEIPLSPRGNTRIVFTVSNDLGQRSTVIQIMKTSRPFTIEYPKTFINSKGLPQANINSNYSVIELRSEYADRVIYGDDIIERDPTTGLFRFEARDIKKSATIKFTVEIAGEKHQGSLVLNNLDQPIVGAQYKAQLKNKMSMFNGQLQVEFKRNSSLMRTGGDGDPNQYITRDRWLLFGIANEVTGEVDPIRDPAPGNSMSVAYITRDPNFRPVSNLFWIDAGIISKNSDLERAYSGSGLLPLSGDDPNVWKGSSYYMSRGTADIVRPTERVTITLQYDPYIPREGWRYLTVFQYNILEDSAGVPRPQWKNLGGVVDTKKNTITVEADSFGYFQVMYMTHSFDDIIEHRWAKHELETMYSKGYMEPKNPPYFAPYDYITRGEFITMLVKMFDVELDYKGQPTFIDVTGNDIMSSQGMYDYRYIETAARKGFIRGTGGRQFKPMDPITREQAAEMIAAVGNLKLESNPTRVENQLKFTDVNDINAYHRAAVLAVTKEGLMTGIPNNVLPGEKQTHYFNPRAYLSRDEAAVIALRILDSKDRTFK